jgi:hypothetical protein
MTDLSQAAWRKASLSVHNGGCVEVAPLGTSAAVRDSKRPEGGALVVSRAAFAALVTGLKDGRFSL